MKKLILFLAIIIVISGCGQANITNNLNMKLSSSDFENNGALHESFTCDGSDMNPPLTITDVPENTKSLALIVDDPDAPMGIWVHWVVWNIDPKTTEIGTDSVPTDSIQGVTSFGNNQYGGPCPPSGTHRYYFKLYALDTTLDIPQTSDKAALEHAMKNHILDEAQLMGTYSRF